MGYNFLNTAGIFTKILLDIDIDGFSSNSQWYSHDGLILVLFSMFLWLPPSQTTYEFMFFRGIPNYAYANEAYDVIPQCIMGSRLPKIASWTGGRRDSPVSSHFWPTFKYFQSSHWVLLADFFKIEVASFRYHCPLPPVKRTKRNIK